MILVAGGTKGGSGKTTIATTLAIMRAAAGRDVLLIDADDQETASDFTVLRNERLPGGGRVYEHQAHRQRGTDRDTAISQQIRRRHRRHWRP